MDIAAAITFILGSSAYILAVYYRENSRRREIARFYDSMQRNTLISYTD